MQFKDFTKEHIPIYGVSVLLAIGAVFFDLVPYYLVYRLLLDVAQGCSERTALQYAAADFACALASNSDALSFDCALA